MKGSDGFKKAIQAYLEIEAGEDHLFAETLKKPNKNIDECVNYVLGEVRESGNSGFADAEIFGMAKHYYDEDDIKDVKAVSAGRVVVNYHAEISEEEKAEAKKKALDKIIQEEQDRLTQKNKKIKEKAAIIDAKAKTAEAKGEAKVVPIQSSLF